MTRAMVTFTFWADEWLRELGETDERYARRVVRRLGGRIDELVAVDFAGHAEQASGGPEEARPLVATVTYIGELPPP